MHLPRATATVTLPRKRSSLAFTVSSTRTRERTTTTCQRKSSSRRGSSASFHPAAKQVSLVCKCDSCV